MAFVTPRLSLKVWNSPSDPYNSQQLADNWIKVDLHDHSPGKGTQITSSGIADSAILENHLAPSLRTTPLYNFWRPVAERFGTVPTGWAAGTYSLGIGAGLNSSLGAGIAFYLDPADYPIPTSGLSLQVRLVASVFTNNSTAPGVDTIFELRPLTLVQSGTAFPTTGGGTPVVTSVTIPSPPLNTSTRAVGSTVAFPAAGYYALFVTLNSAAALNSSYAVRSVLQVSAA